MTRRIQILTDEQVIRTREQVRQEGRLNLRERAIPLGVTHPTLHSALTGKTFKHLPDPITVKDFDRTTRAHRLNEVDKDEITGMRLENPIRWTYAALAQWCNNRHQTRYGPINIKRIIEQHTGQAIPRPAGAPTNSPKTKVRVHKAVPRGMRIINVDDATARKTFAEKFLARRAKESA